MNEPTLIGALALRAGAKISTRTDIGVVFQVQERRHAAIQLVGQFQSLGACEREFFVAQLASDSEECLHRLSLWMRAHPSPSMRDVLDMVQPLAARICSVAATLGRQGVLFVFSIRETVALLVNRLRAESKQTTQTELVLKLMVAEIKDLGYHQEQLQLALMSGDDARANMCALTILQRLDEGLQAFFSTQLSAQLQLIRSASASRMLLNFITNREAVHPFSSSLYGLSKRQSMMLRIGGSIGRLCYSLQHPFLPQEPMCFVQIALAWIQHRNGVTGPLEPPLGPFTGASDSYSSNGGILDGSLSLSYFGDPTASVQSVLGLNRWIDRPLPRELAEGPTVAVLYSITNAFPRALKGLQLASHLLVLALESIRRKYPSVEQVLTLSPIPSFRRWVELQFQGVVAASEYPKAALAMFGDTKDSWLANPTKIRRLYGNGTIGMGQGHTSASADTSNITAAGDRWHGRLSTDYRCRAVDLAMLCLGISEVGGSDRATTRQMAWLKSHLSRWASYYLLFERRSQNGGKAADPVANFHLSNGGSVERIVAYADTTERGWMSSFGTYVNYCYRSAVRGGLARATDVYVSRGVVCSPAAAMQVARFSGLTQSARVTSSRWAELVAGLKTESLPVIAVRLKKGKCLEVPDVPACTMVDDVSGTIIAGTDTAVQVDAKQELRVWYVVRGTLSVLPTQTSEAIEVVAGDAVGLEAARHLALHAGSCLNSKLASGCMPTVQVVATSDIPVDLLGVPLVALALAMVRTTKSRDGSVVQAIDASDLIADNNTHHVGRKAQKKMAGCSVAML